MSLPLGTLVVVLVIGFLASLYLAGDPAKQRGRVVPILGTAMAVIAIIAASSFDTKATQARADELHVQVAKSAEAERENAILQADIQKLGRDVDSAHRSLADRESELLKERAHSDEERQKAAATIAAIEASLKEAVDKVAKLECKSLDCVITFAGNNFLFEPDEFKLNCDKREALAKLSAFLLFRLRTAVYTIDIVGHSDNTYKGSSAARTKEYNDSLSKKRADAVAEYLRNAGISKEIIIRTRGAGMQEPAGYQGVQTPEIIRQANLTEKQRAANRRVTVDFVSQ